MKTVKRVAKNSMLSFLGNNTTKILTLLLTIFIARFFTEVEFGRLSFALSFVGLFAIAVDLGIRLVVIREVTLHKKTAGNILKNAIFLKFISGAFVFAVVQLLVYFLGYPEETRIAVLIATGIIIFESFSNTLDAIYQGFERFEYSASMKIFRVALRFGITLPLLFYGFTLIPVLLAYLGVMTINLMISLLICTKKFAPLTGTIDFTMMKELIKKGFPFLLSSALVIIYFRIDITMLSYLQGDVVVAWYTAAYTLIDAIITIPMALTAALLPVMILAYKSSKQKCSRIYALGSKILFALSFPIAAGGTLIANDLIQTIYGPNYANATLALQILLWVCIPLFFVHLLGAILIAIRREKEGVPALFITCLVNIILNAILIPQYSFMGAAIATILSEILYCAMYFRIVAKEGIFFTPYASILKSIIATLGMVWVLLYVDGHFMFMILLGALVYGALFYVLAGISKDDKELIRKVLKRS